MKLYAVSRIQAEFLTFIDNIPRNLSERFKLNVVSDLIQHGYSFIRILQVLYFGHRHYSAVIQLYVYTLSGFRSLCTRIFDVVYRRSFYEIGCNHLDAVN